MTGNTKSETLKAGDFRTSAVEVLSEGEIKKAIRSDAVQHPVTILPFTVSVVALIYFVLFSPVLGGGLGALVLFGISGGLAFVTYFWRYFLHFNQLYEAKVQQLMAGLEVEDSLSEEEKLKQLQETLQSGFADLNINEGLKALGQLNDVYQRLHPVLDSKRATDPMSVAHIPGLAEETYKQGLSVLADSLQLMSAVHSPANERLEQEVVELEKELETMRVEGPEPQLGKMKEETLASHRETLDLIKQQELRVAQLLHQCGSCEASLRNTSIEVAALQSDTAESSVRAVTDILRKTITQAKEVQEELKRLGY